MNNERWALLLIIIVSGIGIVGAILRFTGISKSMKTTVVVLMGVISAVMIYCGVRAVHGHTIEVASGNTQYVSAVEVSHDSNAAWVYTADDIKELTC